jgi:hypothetical protein
MCPLSDNSTKVLFEASDWASTVVLRMAAPASLVVFTGGQLSLRGRNS